MTSARPERGPGCFSNGRANTSTVIDLKTLKPLGTLTAGGNPDAIFCEPPMNEVCTFDGPNRGRVRAATGGKVATGMLSGKPEARVEDRRPILTRSRPSRRGEVMRRR